MESETQIAGIVLRWDLLLEFCWRAFSPAGPQTVGADSQLPESFSLRQ
jgi:hypothetical protein